MLTNHTLKFAYACCNGGALKNRASCCNCSQSTNLRSFYNA